MNDEQLLQLARFLDTAANILTVVLILGVILFGFMLYTFFVDDPVLTVIAVALVLAYEFRRKR